MLRLVYALFVSAAVSTVSTSAVAAESVAVFAAGSLRAVLSDIATGFTRSTGVEVRFTFGPSGLLKERIENGEAADLFASANMEHPQGLAARGLAGRVSRFARNEICALTSPALAQLTSQTLLATLLDPAVKVGISTPKADPAGDYAFQVFERAADIAGAQTSALLKGKALQLTGGRDSPAPPSGRNVYAELVASGAADVFLTYCSTIPIAIKEQPSLRRVDLPKNLAVGADYGMTVLRSARPATQQFADYLLGAAAQERFKAFGFAGASEHSASLTIDLPGRGAQSMSLEQVQKLGRKTVSIAIPGRGNLSFTGVPVFEILQAAGYQLDQPKRGAYLTQYVLFMAHDGYQVLYAMGEIDPKSKHAAPMLVWEQDGQALKASEGPYRIILPDNPHTSRWIRQVKQIVVRSN